LKSTSKQNLWLGVIAVVLLVGIAWFSLRDRGDSSEDAAAVKSAGTLSPNLFEGKTREAYQAALDVPEVLEKLPCFCGCMQNNGHENNLFCFKDSHAAT
jgi:hypothetical protein